MTFDPLIFTDDYLRGGDWQFMVEPLRKLGHCNHIAFIFPYLDYKESNDRSGISKNEALVQKIVHEEIVKGCDPARIAVGGYNEGLDVALLAILADTNKIGGVLGITDRLALTDAIKELRKTANAKTPVFVVGRSGAKNNAGGKLFTAIGRPVGAVVDGSKNASSSSQPVTQEELEDLDTFIHQTLPVEIAPKN